MNIVFPELNHPIIKSALETYNSTAAVPVTPIAASNLAEACTLVTSGAADSLIAGIDYSSRDVILACRDAFGMGTHPELSPNFPAGPYLTFSGLAVMVKNSHPNKASSLSNPDSQIYLLADMAACKHPNSDQITEIIAQTYTSAQAILNIEPRIALLSFSTKGSGGHDTTIDLMQQALATFRDSSLLIDGEMQLDAAIDPAVGAKKFPGSPVAGEANVLIAPDLNSGNILYKAFERLGGYTVAGPILQGFNFPVSDLSRGSTVADVVLTVETMVKLTQKTA